MLIFTALGAALFCAWKYANIETPKNFENVMRYKTRRSILKIIAFVVVKYEEVIHNRIEPIIFRNLINRIISYVKIPANPNLKKEDKKIDGIDVRIYTPNSLENSNGGPIIIYYHGGGYYFGSPQLFDGYITRLCLKLNARAISVDYKMAPEHPFPTPTDDCFTVTKYILESVNEFGDTNKVILAGDSAGGNAVAVMTQRLKAENIKMPILQVLIYPWTQMFNNRLPTHIRYEKAFFDIGRGIAWYLGITNENVGSKNIGDIITNNHHINLITDESLKEKFISYTDPSLIPDEYKKGKDYYNKYSLKSEKVFPTESQHSIALKSDPKISELLKKVFTPEVSPGLADPEKLEGLPDAYFVMTELDPLKDEGLIYSQRLKNAGVKVDVKFYESAYHGINGVVGKKDGYQIARVMQNDLISHIKSIIET